MRLLLHELRAQQLLFWRNREAAFFSFLFPILLLVLIGSVYGDEPIEGVSAPTFLLIGLLGYGVSANAFADSRSRSSSAERLGSSSACAEPRSGPGTYLAAVIGSTVVVIALEVVAQLLLGVYLLDADWPDRPLRFPDRSCWAPPPSPRSASPSRPSSARRRAPRPWSTPSTCPWRSSPASSSPPSEMPAFLQAIAEVLPLTYFLDLIRASFVADESFATSAVAAVVVWGLVGLVVALRGRCWEPREGVTDT